MDDLEVVPELAGLPLDPSVPLGSLCSAPLFYREQELATQDPLTGLYNHRHFHETIEIELERCRRHGGELGLALFDLDGFKQVNDTGGHAEGDEVLRKVADALKGTCRRSDLAFRIGGDEFALVLPASNLRATRSVADRAQLAVGAVDSRMAWVFPLTYAPRALSPSLRRRDPYPSWRATLIVAWTGMRGAVSLAAALALPLLTDADAAFPNRELIVFLTFSVILATLLLQGLSLPPLIEWLGLDDGDDSPEREENEARRKAAEAALARLEELDGEDWIRDDTVERLRGAFDYRHRRFSTRFGAGANAENEDDAIDYEERTASYQRLSRELIEAQRATVIEMRDRGEIDDDVLRAIERELDLEDSRLEI